MRVLKAIAAHSAVSIVFLFLMVVTFATTMVWGALIRPFLTAYLWMLFLFKGESDSWVGVSRRIYGIEYTLGLWVSSPIK